MMYDPPIDNAPSYDQLFYELVDAKKLNAELVAALEMIESFTTVTLFDEAQIIDAVKHRAKAAIAKATDGE